MQYNVPYTIDLHTGNPVPFLYTPTSLLPEHSVLTDVQQATGMNGQQGITCWSGGQGPRPEIWMGSNEVALSSSTGNSARIGLGTCHPNGLYHCLSAQSQRRYFSLFLRNSGTVHAWCLLMCMPNSLACTARHILCANSTVLVCMITSYSLICNYSHSTNTKYKCLGHFSVDPHIARWQQSGEICCRVWV